MPDFEIDLDNPAFLAAAETAKTAPVVVQPNFDDIKDLVIGDDAPAAETEATPDTPPAAAVIPSTEPNYAEYLTTKSGGLFKTEDEFIVALEKFKNYDTLETRAKDLETKVPQFKNEEARQWFDMVQSEDGTAILKSYISEKEKDYKTMSDVDIMKNALKAENPAWDSNRINLELRHKYGTNLEKIDTSGLDPEDDADEIKEANAHNREVDKNLELLQMHAFDKRIDLVDKQSKLTLPEIKKAEIPAQNTQPTDAEIAERTAAWQKKVEETVPGLSNFKIDIDDKGVEYVWTDDEKAAQVAEMKDFNIFKWMQSEGWTNADNTWNPDKIAEGVRLLRDHKKIITAVASQVKTDAIKATYAKIKGIDPNYRAPDDTPKKFNTLEEAAHDAIAKARAKKRNVEYEEAD